MSKAEVGVGFSDMQRVDGHRATAGAQWKDSL